ncbi:ABC transporter ATP-binding protein [Paracoccus aminophilus]|uniref:ABC-type dipeptide/oligopeptide/nickel transport system, ATPase component n=1 Tax=Paracoccus aminophilus JCM 7686 TaxID=1367847 RepID=S5XQJ2_PARAH|nr:ABC transporter ATP-binding protein [Paracoccus aminophilus]AGT07332.1 ABC-type dipeptide/oligopeptide/nickel transport system, ATPase component [Paracoccus aminophilus JCM 7686]
MSAVLSVENLSVAFGPARPVAGVSFKVNPRETLAIVGESGSGKSLTALAMMGLLPGNAKTSGAIRIATPAGPADMLSLPEKQRRRLRGSEVAMVFQEPMTSLNPVHTIGHQIGEVLIAHENLGKAARRARVIELLNLVRIPDAERRIDDYPHQLSGGMRQRVMIAIAVACRPRILIADEATTALDVTIQAQILQLLDQLRRELDMAVVLITHDLGIVSQWADRVVVMYAGHHVEEGPPDTVFAQPAHPYTSGLLAASPRLHGKQTYRDAALTEIPGSITSAKGERGCPFRPRCQRAAPICAEAIPASTVEPGDRRVACHFPGPALAPPAQSEPAHVPSFA